MGRFRGTWHLGWSYSKGDTAIYNGKYYKANSQIPCYGVPPDVSDLWDERPKKIGDEKNGTTD